MIDTIERTQQNLLLEPVIILLILLGAVVVGAFLEFLALPRLQKLAKRKRWPGGDLILGSLRGMIMVWSILIGAAIVVFQLEAVPSQLLLLFRRVLFGLVIISLVIVAIRITTSLVTSIYTGKGENASVSILQNSITVLIALVGLLIGLQSLGVSITPALATLGVGGLAVSLALQDTLANLFSGVWLVASNQIRSGHYVRLSNGEEGYVVDINWRTTNIRQLSNNMIVVPNTVMTSSVMINYYVPDREVSVLVDVGVSYDSDLAQVERVTCEVAREVLQEVEGGVPDAEPMIRYNQLQDFSINFTAILRAKEYVNQYLLKHEFLKRLTERYRQEGIVIPFPTHTLQTPDARYLEIMNLAAKNGRQDGGHTSSDLMSSQQ